MSTPYHPVFASADYRWLDLLGLVIVLAFLVLGARRGLWWQVVRLLGLVAAVAVARAAAPRLGPELAAAIPDLSPRVASGIVWTIVILLGLVAVAIIARLGRASLEESVLGGIDRVGGGVAGALTGALVHAAIVLCLCQLGSADWSVAQVRGTTSQRLVDSLARKVPLFLDARTRGVLEPWLTRPIASAR